MLAVAQAALAAPETSAQRTLAEARSLHEKGALRDAQELYASLLPGLRDENRNAFAAALNALSQIASAQGDYPTAASRARDAAEVYRELGDRAGETRAVNNVGVAELYRGDYRRALSRFQQALELSRTGTDREAEIEELNNLGSVFFLQARYLDALGAYRTALDRVAESPDAPWHARRRRLTISNLAALFQRLGAYEQSLDLYGQVRKSSEALPASEQARVLTNLGALYRRLEDPFKALETYQAAERLFAKDRHLDGEIAVLKNIGIVHALDFGDFRSALEAFTRAVRLAEESGNRREAMQARLYRGETLLRLGDLDTAREELAAALATATQLDTKDDRWKALYGLGRVAWKTGHDDDAAALFQKAISAVESVRSNLRLSSLKTDFLADKREVYDALVELLAGRAATADVFDLLERSRARTFQDRLREHAGNGGPSTASLAAVQARLDAHTLLLEYWVTPRAALVVWVTRDDSGLARITFPAAAEEEVASLAREISSGSGDGWRRASESLGARLLSGIEPMARPALRHLVIVPDGPLSAIPYEVLQAPGAGGALLVERFDVSYVPSAAVLLRDAPRRSGAWSPPWARRLLAFADPLVPVSAAGPLPGETPRARLVTSAAEAQEIARIAGGRAELRLGAANTKKELLEGKARGVTLLHLSTHATADDVNPERSRILFSPARPGDGPDYLFLKEVYDLDLRGVELATLSACDTERGKVVRAEGVQGFSRALLSAGARTAVTTLWRVADRPTTTLMEQFYFELERGQPKAEALQQAKLRFLRSNTVLRHPRFWAAFVLTGDGRSPIPRRLPWNGVLAPIALGLLAVAVRRRRRTRP